MVKIFKNWNVLYGWNHPIASHYENSAYKKLITFETQRYKVTDTFSCAGYAISSSISNINGYVPMIPMPVPQVISTSCQKLALYMKILNMIIENVPNPLNTLREMSKMCYLTLN